MESEPGVGNFEKGGVGVEKIWKVGVEIWTFYLRLLNPVTQFMPTKTIRNVTNTMSGAIGEPMARLSICR